MRFGVVLLLAMLVGCSMNPPAPPDPEFAPIRPVVAVPPVSDNGTIYQQNYGMSLFSDVSAKRVGDVITVILQENTNARKSAATKTSKDSEVDLPTPSVLGQSLSLLGKPISASLSGSTAFDGKGDSAQSNSLTGRVTVTVSEVLPNGYLVVQGEKRLTLNQGAEHIKFSGVVRPADVRSDNTILSGNVANAQIIYSSSGVLADANSQGWLSRVFNSPWWPF